MKTRKAEKNRQGGDETKILLSQNIVGVKELCMTAIKGTYQALLFKSEKYHIKNLKIKQHDMF